MTTQQFDIGFVTSHFGTCDLGHYLHFIEAASTPELRSLRSQIKAHKRTNRTHAAFSNTPSLTSHDALLRAVGYTLLKRSPVRYWLWSTALPLRQQLVRVFSGLVLKKNEQFGAIYIRPERRTTIFHMPHKELGQRLRSFAGTHWKFLATTVVAVAAIVVKWLKA